MDFTTKVGRKFHSDQVSITLDGNNLKWERDASRINFHGIVNGTLDFRKHSSNDMVIIGCQGLGVGEWGSEREYYS